MKAIVTKYYGPTDKRPARVTAKAEGVRAISIPADGAPGDVDLHRTAAILLCAMLDWCGELVGGTLPDGQSRVWVFSESHGKVHP